MKSFAQLRAGSALVAGLTALAMAGPAGAQEAPVTIAENDFGADLQGWEALDASCSLLGLTDVPAPFCAVGSSWDGAEKAAITTFTPLANAGGALVGESTLRSPSFAVPADADVGSATLEVDRKAAVDALVDAGGTARWTVSLLDESAGEGARPVELLTDDLSANDDVWVTRSVRLDGDQLSPGHSYRIVTRSTFTTQTAQALMGTTSVALDNVLLTALPPVVGPKGEDGAGGANGANGASGGPGSDGLPGIGVPGAPGMPGPAAAPAEVRTVAASGTPARVNSPEARRLLRIDRLAVVRFKGPFANQLRLRVLCRTTVLSRCEGTVKIRSVRRINAALGKGRKRMKRVTLGTGSYQLARRQLGYAKVFLTPVNRRLVAKRSPIAVTVQVTVLDQKGNQQRLQRTFLVRT
jgi:hypothetical protein